LPREGLARIIAMGGDTDSTAAILGGIYGAALGRDALPDDWLRGIADSPRSARWIEKLARRLAHAHTDPAESPGPSPLCWPVYLLRSPIFMAVVLCHGFRRLLPPYE
jgi:hypothetical protein